MDWFVWRVLVHPKVNETMNGLEQWSLDDLLDAHLVLDMLEDAEVKYKQGLREP